MAEDGHIRLLAAEVGRLHNAVEKLVASNAELRLAIAEQGDDDDRTFKTAIEENIVVIAKYRAQAERLEAELAELRAGRQPLGTAQALPTRELTAGGAAPAAEGAGGQQAGGQHQEQQGQAGHDAPTAGLASAGQEGGSGGRQAPDGGGGMWM